jgi:hypothetical protein
VADVVAEITVAASGGDRHVHRLDRVRIFRADVDVALGGADRDAGDRHTLDHHERIAFHQHAVGEGAAVALVGVAADVLLAAPGLGHGAPFGAGRKTGAAAPAQARLDDVVDDRVRAQLQRALEAAIAAVSAIVVDRTRIDDAAASEGQPCLPLQPGDLFGRAELERMRRIRHNRIENRADLRRCHRSVGGPAGRGLDLQHRFEPIQPA